MDLIKLKDTIEMVKEPRRKWGNLRHKLEDILIIGLCSVICMGEDFVDMEIFGKERKEWLESFLELPNGIPDSDTFRRVFEKVKPEELSKWLNDWIKVERDKMGRLVNIDGKTICGSANKKHKNYHVVSAWVGENSITLGELEVGEKSNEITAVPNLLDLLDIDGDIITADAMSCQTKIVAKIREKKANYVLALKGNQQTMEKEVAEYFKNIETMQLAVKDQFTSPLEKGHGRIEKREVTVVSADWFVDKSKWTDLQSFIQVRSFVTINDVQTISERHYISNLTEPAQRFNEIIRGHWSIENNLHWCLDVIFNEDAARAKKDNSPLNMNVIRKLSLTLLKFADMGKRMSIAKKRLKSALNPECLLSVLIGK